MTPKEDIKIEELQAVLVAANEALTAAKEVIEDLSDHGSAAERMALLKGLRAEIERWKTQHEEMLLKHAKEQGVALSALETALTEIERLKVLVTRAANALEAGHEGRTGLPYEEKPGCQLCDLISELRKAAE